MTSEQAAQLIAQNDKLLAVWNQVLPLLQSFDRDIFPALAVFGALALGIALGRAAT